MPVASIPARRSRRDALQAEVVVTQNPAGGQVNTVARDCSRGSTRIGDDVKCSEPARRRGSLPVTGFFSFASPFRGRLPMRWQRQQGEQNASKTMQSRRVI